MKNIEVTSDGWSVSDQKEFHFLVDHPTPRPYGFWDQVRVDAKSWMCIGLWVAAAGFVAAGILTGQLLWLAPSFGLLGIWRAGYRMTVREIRHGRVAVGLVGAFERHPLRPSCSNAVTHLADGRQIRVTIDTRLVRGIIDSGEQAEITYLGDPNIPSWRAIGARAVHST